MSAHRIARRQALALSVGCAFWVAGPARRAFCQSSIRIDRFSVELDRVLSASEPIHELASGFGNDSGNAEGPLWWKEGRYLLFSDIGKDRRMKYEPARGASVVKEAVNRANGLTRDVQGRLVAAEQETRQLARYEATGARTIIANSYEGKRLNRPNDVIVKSDGAIYFTDPFNRSPQPPEQWEQPVAGVYRVSPDLATVTRVAGDFMFPNGLAFSPDEDVLYINDTSRGHIRAFDVMPNGSLATQSARVFATRVGTSLAGRTE